MMKTSRQLIKFIMLLTILFLVTSVSLIACRIENTDDDKGNGAEIIEAPVETEPPDNTEETEETDTEARARGPREYSITVGDGYVALQDWDDTVDLYELLGEPLSEEVEVLGQGSDTFAGSYLKTIKYEDLEIILFSPEDNGESFWVMEIIVSGNDHTTYRGIGIGDTLETLKDKYPSVSRVEDGRTDEYNRAYEVSDMESYNYLRFEISEGIVSEIRLFHMMP